MKVKVEFIVETEDFGRNEFEKEIIKLIEDIDSYAELLTFSMKEIKTK